MGLKFSINQQQVPKKIMIHTSKEHTKKLNPS
jgi:hypothetical protein